MMAQLPTRERSISETRTNPTPWAEAFPLLAGVGTYFLTVKRPDGLPHTRPILGVAVDGALYFCASAASRKAQHLAADAQITLVGPGEQRDFVVEGTAQVTKDAGLAQLVAEAYGSKYGWHPSVVDAALVATGAPTAGPPPYEVYRITPRVVFAFGKVEEVEVTRWEFS